MKSHAPKLLRSTSKARAWYGFALVFGIGILLIPSLTKAALTSPVPVVTGTGYGQLDSLGLRDSSGIIDEDSAAWPNQVSNYRRLVYLAPGGKKLLMAAFVNKSTTIPGCSGANPVCRLEFRVSENDGLTWTQALEGATPYLPIAGGLSITKFDYTLYVSPNDQDIWVSYVYAAEISSFDPQQQFTKSKIQKLKWNATLKTTWTLLDAPSEPKQACGGTYDNHCVGETGVAVQIIGNTERVWGIASNTFSDPGFTNAWRSFNLVYCDNFPNCATWNASAGLYNTTIYRQNNGLTKIGSALRFEFFSIGNNKIPGLVFISPRRVQGCTNIDPNGAVFPLGIRLMTLASPEATNWAVQNQTAQIGGDAFPFYYDTSTNNFGGFLPNCNSGTTTISGNIFTTSEPLIGPVPRWSYPLSFSVASMPTGDLKSRVVIAYEGGTDSGNTIDYRNKIRASDCTATVDGTSGPPYNSNFVCSMNYTIPNALMYTSPSVGFYKSNADSAPKAWIAAKNAGLGNSQLALFSENLGSSPWTWNKDATFTTSYDVASPTTAAYIPVDTVKPNTDVVPTMWSHLGGNRVAFGANSGGASIGTNPKVTANPIQGYGWASNFGWLSLNCINKPTQNCDNLFGLGIGSVAASSTTDLPPVTSLSPTSTTTFPLGGYAWSSNAGFLSLERRDSICGSIITCPGGVNVSGSPPSLAYSNYTVDATTATVTINSPTQLTMFTGDCTWPMFQPNTSIAVGFDYSIVKACGAGIVDISGAPLTKYATFPVAGVRVFKVDPNVPLAKYDTSTQHVYGWGRFLNLCNYDTANNRCLNKYNGWVRLRGFYTAGASPLSIDATSSTTIFWEYGCVNFPPGGILSADETYVRVESCSGFTVTLDARTPLPYSSGTHTVYNVTGKEYGLDAFWTGDHYELAGWAWSNDYGWIRFNPLIFIGFSWLETLFGNVYTSGQYDVNGNYISLSGDIELPNAVNLSDERFKTCGKDTSTPPDGIGDEPCYVSTYRIEAGGIIKALPYSGTGYLGTTADSAAVYPGGISAGAGTCDPASPTNSVYCKLQGDAGKISILNSILARGGVTTGPKFPTVGSTTTSYRNALGKLDVGGLTTIIGTASPYLSNVALKKIFQSKQNRFGNTVYKTSLDVNNNPVNWTINELSGWVNQEWPPAKTPVFPLNVTIAEATAFVAPLRSQVVHVQGNLAVDGAEAIFSSISGNIDTTGGTMAVTVAPGVTFPTQNSINSVTVSCLGCALVVDPGGINEEYFSYTTYSAGSFSGVKRIKACGANPLPACPLRTNPDKVRWVWRLPYADNSGTFNGTTNLAQRVTIVVDGDLNIQYNIIATEKSDMSPAPNSIRDLPTIAFVVKGNVTIDPQVNKLTGAFIVSGRDTSKQPDAPDCPSIYGNSCGGAFATGNDNDVAICNAGTKVCRPLTITGLLFARLFAFERIGSLQKNDTPAERVVADERLFLNPPPGLEDVTKALPNPQRTLP